LLRLRTAPSDARNIPVICPFLLLVMIPENRAFSELLPYSPVPQQISNCPRSAPAITWTDRSASTRNRCSELIPNTYPSIMSSHQGSSRRQRQKALRNTQTAGHRQKNANHTEHRPNSHATTTNTTIWQRPASTDDHQFTYSEVAANSPQQALIPYKPTTFHTTDKVNNYLYPFEDTPHLLITGRYSGTTLLKNEIVFQHIFERGHAATREVLQACRTYAVHAIRKRLGIALQTDSQGDPVTVVTKKNNSGSEWFLTGDIRVRFPSKRSVLTAYEQQRAPVKNKDDNNSRILTHEGHINPTIIPT